VIARLRRRHRLWTGLLAVTLPPAFAFALWSRPSPLRMEDLPAALDPAAPAPGVVLWERDDLFGSMPARARLLAEVAGGPPVAVELAPHADPMRPDVLVYWSAGDAREIPPGAVLLGRLAGARTRRFELPEPARRTAGRLHLYSLGHQALLDSAPLRASDR
jgi:hypothetical protein